MARSFDGATSDSYLSLGSAMITALPFAYFAVVKTSDSAGAVVAQRDGSGGSAFARLFVGSGSWGAQYVDDSGTAGTAFSSSPTGNWQRLVAVFKSTTSRTIYVDSTSGTENTTTVSGSFTPDTFTIGANISSGSVVTELDGSVAEVGICNGEPTAAMIAAFMAGKLSPAQAARSMIMAYYPLITNDGDIDRVGGYDLTAVNSPTYAADHPPMAASAPARLIRGGTLVAGGSVVPWHLFNGAAA